MDDETARRVAIGLQIALMPKADADRCWAAFLAPQGGPEPDRRHVAAQDLDEALLDAARRHFARQDGEAVLDSIREGERRLEEIRNRPQGFHPDGTRVSDQEKQAAYRRYEELRDAHRRGGSRQPVYASAGGPSQLIRRTFALD